MSKIKLILKKIGASMVFILISSILAVLLINVFSIFINSIIY